MASRTGAVSRAGHARRWYISSVRAQLFALGAVLLAGCANRSAINSPTGDGGQWFSITCPWGSDACYEEAAQACPNGYDVDQRSAKAGKPRNFSAWRNTLIRCRQPGEDPPTEATTEPPPTKKKKAKKAGPPPEAEAADEDGGSLKTVESARWQFRVPKGWSIAKSSKGTSAQDDDGRHRATLVTTKTTDPLPTFAAERFKGWHTQHEAKIAKRDAVLADDFDGTSQSLAVLVIADGVAYQLTCVDVEKGKTSETCRAIVRSLRIQDPPE